MAIWNGSMEKFKQICKTLSWKYIHNIIIIVSAFFNKQIFYLTVELK
jgi:hypothetical protein